MKHGLIVFLLSAVCAAAISAEPQPRVYQLKAEVWGFISGCIPVKLETARPALFRTPPYFTVPR